MEVIYENATKNDEPLHKLFEFGVDEQRADKVMYDGHEYDLVFKVAIIVKKGGKVYATSQPTKIDNMPDTKGLRK